jgi:transcriptional regulator with XRE-family HTH domain
MEVPMMDISIGERIKSRRKELNITQVQIREATGISSGNMSGIESGKSLPSASALIELSKVLNCSIDWMLTGNSPISESVILSNIEEDLLTGFRELPEDDKDELIGILKMKLRKIQRARGTSAKSSDLTGTEKGDMVG